MTTDRELERRYRRLMGWYPRAFRAQHEQEMLVVLMACARNGQRRPGPADSANLIANALLMRLRPGVPRSRPTVFWAVRVMALGALLELVALATVIGTRGELSATIARHAPSYSAAHIHAFVSGQVLSIAIGAPLAALAWLWLAWANGRGHRWARVAFGALFALTSVSLFASVGRQAQTYAPADLIAGAVVWVAALLALVLITAPSSAGHYVRRRDAGETCSDGPMMPIRPSWN
jgi:hypothetical protein